MNNSERLYNKLLAEGIVGATGETIFKLNNIALSVQDRSVVGNLIQEWLKKFMDLHGFAYNLSDNTQEFPDFYLDTKSTISDLIEVKCFTSSPNFDIANFQAYARSLLEKPYRLDANYLIFEYALNETKLEIKNLWLKKVWQIASASERSPVKIQWKQGIPVNIRPATWYSDRTSYPVFESRNDFVVALKSIIDISPQCENIRKDWYKKVASTYKEQIGKEL